MATFQIVEQDKAIAIDEAMQTIDQLLPDEAPSERLHSARHDALGGTDVNYRFAMVIGELTRVLAHQQERIEDLEVLIATKASAAEEKPEEEKPEKPTKKK